LLVPSALALNNQGHVDIGVTHVVLHNVLFRTTPGLAPSRSVSLECMARKFREYVLSLESAGPESPQKLFANIRGQSDSEAYARHLESTCRTLRLLGLPERRGSRPHTARGVRCHTRDLSAVVDRVSHGCVEVGICWKQRVKVGHHALLPDEAMGPVEVGVQVLPTTWPWLLMPLAKAPKSPGRVPRFVIARSCQSAA